MALRHNTILGELLLYRNLKAATYFFLFTMQIRTNTYPYRRSAYMINALCSQFESSAFSPDFPNPGIQYLAILFIVFLLSFWEESGPTTPLWGALGLDVLTPPVYCLFETAGRCHLLVGVRYHQSIESVDAVKVLILYLSLFRY